MGADVKIEHGMVHAYGRNGKLKGAKIYLDYPSVGATETLMMAATLAEGETTLENAAKRLLIWQISVKPWALRFRVLEVIRSRLKVFATFCRLHHQSRPD